MAEISNITIENENYLIKDSQARSDIQTLNNTISDLDTIRSNAQIGANLSPQVEANTQRIEDLTVSKFPNATPIGKPQVQDSYVSGFSDSIYMIFPFTDISRGLPFDIYFSFTTSSDVTTQQNILDSYFGMAVAIANGKGLMAISTNGINWESGSVIGTNAINPNTTYYAKLSWTGTQYTTAISTDSQTYTPDMVYNNSNSPHKTTIYIGSSPNLFGPSTAHPFKGTINFKGARVYLPTLGIDVWEGMADVGLGSRANVSLNNLDELGEKRFTDLQDNINTRALNSSLTTHTSNNTIHVTASDKVAWSQKQNTSDNSLATTDKTIVGAINELNTVKQDLLISGTNIKTINGESVLGSGDLEIKSGGGYHPNILSFKWSDHLINDIQWLRADTFSWQSGDVYVTAYNTLVEEYTNGTTETEDNITFIRSINGFKIADESQEEAILNKYNNNGIAWYYILDTANKRFKLPRTKFGFKGLRDSVGGDISESLPNIKGEDYLFGPLNQQKVPTGPYKKTSINVGRGYSTISQSDFDLANVDFDASRSSSTYQDNAPVQERATQMYLYFYVGEYTREAIEQTAGITSEQLNNKLDLHGITNATSVDGQWVTLHGTIDGTMVFDRVVPANGSYDFSLIDLGLIPDDGYTYEILYCLATYADAGSAFPRITTDLMSQPWKTSNDTSGHDVNGTTLTKNKIINIACNVKLNTCRLYLQAFRRMGTNQ